MWWVEGGVGACRQWGRGRDAAAGGRAEREARGSGNVAKQ